MTEPTADLYSVIGAAELDRSLDWYRTFFGRPADEVIGDEHLWQLSEHAWVVIDARPVRAARVGGAMLTLGVTDLDRILDRLVVAGITHGEVETYSNGVRHVVIDDPDGNELSLAQAP